jgi:hypothetical protein
MSKEQVTKIKRLISKLGDLGELRDIEKHTKKRWNVTSKRNHLEEKERQIETIRNLPVGTLVMCDKSRSGELAGLVGKIIRHKQIRAGYSSKTVVEYEKKGRWSIPSIWLTDDVSKENLKRIQQNLRMNLNPFRNIESKEIPK